MAPPLAGSAKNTPTAQHARPRPPSRGTGEGGGGGGGTARHRRRPRPSSFGMVCKAPRQTDPKCVEEGVSPVLASLFVLSMTAKSCRVAASMSRKRTRDGVPPCRVHGCHSPGNDRRRGKNGEEGWPIEAMFNITYLDFVCWPGRPPVHKGWTLQVAGATTAAGPSARAVCWSGPKKKGKGVLNPGRRGS